MKKILMIGLCAFLMLITLTGCDKKENNNANASYYRSMDYSTLVAAAGSREDSFIIFFYEEDGVNSKYTKEKLQEYANTNKVTIYEFDLTQYLKQYTIDNKNTMKETEEEFVNKCMAIIDEDEIIEEPTYEQVCDEYNEFGDCISSRLEEIEPMINNKYVYTKEECEEFHENNFQYNRKLEIYDQFDIKTEGMVVFMKKTFRSATFDGYVPDYFSFLNNKEQQEILDKSNKELTDWLDGIYKNNGTNSKNKK